MLRQVGLAAILVAGCSGAEPLYPCEVDAARERERFGVRVRELAQTPPLPLVRVARAEEMEPLLPRVLVGPDSIRVDSASRVLAAYEANADLLLSDTPPERWGEWLPPPADALVRLEAGRAEPEAYRGDPLIERLVEADEPLLALERSRALALHVAPSIPWETVARVLDSAQRAGRRELRVAVAMGSDVGAIPVVLPAPPRPERLDSVLDLRVTVTAEGYVVAGAGGRLVPGCRTTGRDPRPTVPGHEVGALQRCLRRVKGEFPEERMVTIGAADGVPFERVVPALLAARGDTDGELFPDLALATGAP